MITADKIIHKLAKINNYKYVFSLKSDEKTFIQAYVDYKKNNSRILNKKIISLEESNNNYKKVRDLIALLDYYANV